MSNHSDAYDVRKHSVTAGDAPPKAWPFWQMALNGTLGGKGDAPPFWTPARDLFFKQTIYRESMWASAVHIAITKMASQGWEVRGQKERVVGRAQELLLAADRNQSWSSFIQRQLQDYLLTGNGQFFEIVRAKESRSARIIGLIHLDSQRVMRTGDDDRPCLYRDRQNRLHEMRDYEVVALSDMPDSSDTFNGVGHCLQRESRVRLADGSTRKIAELVHEHYAGDVMSIDAEGRLIPARVIGWHKNPMGNRTWVNVRGKHSSRWSGKVTRNLWLTNDHPVLTPSGYVRADALQNGDLLVTEHPSPNRLQQEMIIGGVLGDMSLTARGSQRARLSLAHDAAQREWFDLKVSALGDFNWKTRQYKNVFNGETRAHQSLAEWHARLYPNGKKNVSPAIVEEYLSPLLMAVWYLDDGWIEHRAPNDRNRRPTAQIGNSGAPDGHSEQIAAIFTRAGYECHAVSARHSGNFRKDIHFSAAGSGKFFEAIAPYVPSCMRYKLPMDAACFVPSLWDIGIAERYIDTAVVSHSAKRAPRVEATVYCLDVEGTHNFATASGLVVHNCAGERAIKAINKLAAIEQFIYEKVSGKRSLAVHMLGGVSEHSFLQAIKAAQEEASQKGAIVYMGATVIPIPSDIPVTLVTIPLASLPDGFNREQEFNNAVLEYADALGIDVQDLQPLSGRPLGSGAQSTVLDEKARGKGLAAWRQSFIHMMNQHVLPDKTTFAFMESDLREKQQQAALNQTHAVTVNAMVGGQIIDAQMGQQYLVEQGVIPREMMTTPEPAGETLTDSEKLLAEGDAAGAAGGENPEGENAFRDLLAQWGQQGDGSEPVEQPAA